MLKKIILLFPLMSLFLFYSLPSYAEQVEITDTKAPIEQIDLTALMNEAERLGVECDTSRRAKIRICQLAVKEAQLQEELEEKVQDLKDFVNQEGQYQK